MKKENKAKIVEQAISVMSVVPHASMEMIASKVGVSRATLYRHFKTREQLLREMIFESGRICSQIINPILAEDIPSRKKLESFLREFVPTGARFHFLLYNDMFFHESDVDDVYKKQNEALQAIARGMKEEGDMDWLIPDDWFSTTVEYMIYAAWERIHRGDIAQNKAADFIIGMIFKGIAKK